MILPGFKGTHTLRSVILDTAVNMVFQELARRFPVDTFENVAHISSGGTPSRSDSSFYGGDIPWIKISDITAAGKYIEDTEEYITQLAIDNSSTNLFPVNTVLFSMYGSIGKTCILRKPMTTNQAILGLIPSAKITSEYLYYALHAARVELFQSAKGTSQKNINAGMVRRHVIPVPPREIMDSITAFLAAFEAGEPLENIYVPPFLEEQRRIVARVEALAARIEEARGLKVHTFEVSKLLRTTNSRSFFIPDNSAVSLDAVVTIIDPNPSHRYPLYVDNGIPMISTSDFQGEYDISFSNAKNVSEEFYQETLGRFNILSGDVIFARKGKIGYARAHPDKVIAMTHTLCVIKPNREKLNARYLLYFTKSEPFLGYLRDTMNKNVGVPTLGLNVIRSARINLPALEKQNEIVETLDKARESIDILERLQTSTRLELDALLPSVLAKAFAGEL